MMTGKDEITSTLAQGAIQMLLHVHALACMARASDNAEHLTCAAGWLPMLEDQLRAIRRDIDTHTGNSASGQR